MDAIKFLKQLVEGIEKMENCGQVSVEKQENIASTLTEQQKTAIRGRIAEGYLWAARDLESTVASFYASKPKKINTANSFTSLGRYAGTMHSLYDFVTYENSPIYLPDLLGGEE